MTDCRVLALSAMLAACAASAPTPPRELVFYPDPPDPPRIQFLRSISAGSEVEPPRSSGLDRLLFGDQLEVPKPIMKPGAVAFRDGKFYVTDTELAAVFRIDLRDRTVDLLPLAGRARLMNPQSLCFGPDGKAYVADRDRRQIVVLAADFSWDREFGPWSDRSAPTDVTVWRDRLYVADGGEGCVRVLSLTDGKELQVLGKAQREQEVMRGPTNLTVDASGYVYVVDTIYSRIFTWDVDGNFVRQIAAPGDAPGHLARPKGIACHADKLWVIDGAFDNCQIFDFDGRALLYFGGPGTAPGCMSLPRKIWVGSEGLDLFQDLIAPDFTAEALIVVTNSYGAKVNFYALGKSKKFIYPEIALPARPSAMVRPG